MAAIQSASPDAAHWDPADYLPYTCWIAEDAGIAQGFLVARAVAPGESEILNLAVALDSRRRGVARALLAHAIAEQPGNWFLEVRESNTAALELYRSTGFLAFGARPGYYQGGPYGSPETAIVMRLQS